MALSDLATASVSTLGASSTSSKYDKSSKSLADDFDTFLQLLTTQLKAQSPLDPLDTNQFTQELVQFSQVEQQINMNKQLESLIALASAQAASAVVGYLGTEVVAEGATTEMDGGIAEWRYTSPQTVDDATITIRNEAGSVVFTEQTKISSGTNNYEWNGRTSTGQKVTSGKYTITIDARDAENKALNVETAVKGIVDGIDMSGTEPILEIGGTRVPLTAVRSVTARA